MNHEQSGAPSSSAWDRSASRIATGIAALALLSIPDGTPEMSVRLPEGFRGIFARGSRIWGSIQDALGVPYVVRYRVEGEGR